MKTTHGTSRHRRIDSRGLALHRYIAQTVTGDPQAIRTARMNIRRWSASYIQAGAPVPAAFREWDAILAWQTPAAIARLLVARSERAVRLRQSSPFAGLVPPMVRSRILESFAD